MARARAPAPGGPVLARRRRLSTRASTGARFPVYCASLKEPVSAGLVSALLEQGGAEVVLNATGFAVSSPGAPRGSPPFDGQDCPVLQVVFAGSDAGTWREGTQGLGARDLAMNVALPEVDGRLLTRAVSFKGEARFDQTTECPVVAYEPVADRIEWVAELAARWLSRASSPSITSPSRT